MPMKEIARAMKMSLVGVRVRLYRSRMRLGEKLRVPSPAADMADATAVGQRLSIL
jgi:DNA-directed RNA polymerase specialized sigma24 family protein